MSPSGARKFRFGVGLGNSPEEWPSFIRKAEDLGFSTLYVGDHFAGNARRLAPLPALVAAAAVTSKLRLGTIVLANDFRHPAALAKEAATVDVLSNGRFELGIGTGWLRDDYRVAGLPFGSPGERLERLAETVQICKAFFTQETVTFRGKHYQIEDLASFPRTVQRPHPPIMLGGRQRKMLSFAAREANIVSISRVEPGPGQPPAASFAENVEWIRQAAGPRYATIELHTNTHVEVDDNQQVAIERMAARLRMSPDEILQAPARLAGSTTAIIEQLLAWRERLDVSYFTVSRQVMDSMAPVVAHLAGR
jgi:probable F420-dependent oxidoreductase